MPSSNHVNNELCGDFLLLLITSSLCPKQYIQTSLPSRETIITCQGPVLTVTYPSAGNAHVIVFQAELTPGKLEQFPRESGNLVAQSPLGKVALSRKPP